MIEHETLSSPSNDSIFVILQKVMILIGICISALGTTTSFPKDKSQLLFQRISRSCRRQSSNNVPTTAFKHPYPIDTVMPSDLIWNRSEK